MVTRASGLGGGNSILRSIRPGRSKAESRISILLVAMMTCYKMRSSEAITLALQKVEDDTRLLVGQLTLMFLLGSNPSN